MKVDNVVDLRSRDVASSACGSALEEIVRAGARRMLQAALDAEVAEFLAQCGSVLDAEGRRVVVRNGYLPERELVAGIGPIEVQQPRVRDRSGQQKFTSKNIAAVSTARPKCRYAYSCFVS